MELQGPGSNSSTPNATSVEKHCPVAN